MNTTTRIERDLAKRIVRDHLEKLLDTCEIPEWLEAPPEAEERIRALAKDIAEKIIRRSL